MPNVKTTYAYKIQSIVKEFLTILWKVITTYYISNPVTVQFLVANAFVLILIEIRQNIKCS